jgi:hypothetical protein
MKRMDSSNGVLFLWTKDAPHSTGTAREWEYNRDIAHRPYCLATEVGAVPPKDADQDLKRIDLPVWWGHRPGTSMVPSLFRPAPRKYRRLRLYGNKRITFAREVWTFAKSLLVPIV